MLYPQTLSPVQEVPFGQALQISLNNYYDLLKVQSGSLQAEELMQLKLVADPLDISLPLVSDGRYEWYSYHNLIKRADLEIEPGPLAGSVHTGVARISDIYGKFIAKLSSLVVTQVLSSDDQKRKSDLEVEIDAIKEQLRILADADFGGWVKYADLRGYAHGDMAAYNSYSAAYGSADKIEELMKLRIQKSFELLQLINETYSDPDDKEIMDATVAYYASSMRLPYPLFPDYTYLPSVINLNYLLGLPHVSSGTFDDRYMVTFDQALDFIKTTGAGVLSGTFNRTTSDSTSITKDWGASGSVGYFFISVNVSTSEHSAIVEDFKKATDLSLASKAAFRVGINYGPWFKPNLFKSNYIHKHPEMFAEFFNETGSLLYYPTALILIRGFSVEFKSSADWSFDYNHRFSASVGGGFNVFGINFGGSSSYSEETKEHKVDATGTTLRISDDDNTLRFVGYAAKKNTFWQQAVAEQTHANLKTVNHEALSEA